MGQEGAVSVVGSVVGRNFWQDRSAPFVRSAIRHLCPGMDQRLGSVTCDSVLVERVGG